MFKRRKTALAVLLALTATAVSVLPASSASAASSTTTNACRNTVTANFSQISVTTSGDDGVTEVTPGGTTTTTNLTQSAAIPGTIFVAGYNLGLLAQGTNNIPANVQSRIEATNTVEGSQLTNVVGGSPPNGTVSVTTVITDPDGTRGTGDETGTDASFSVTYNNLSWTANGPEDSTIDYRQDSIAALPLSAANQTLTINALIGGFLSVSFQCAPGTVTPPDPGTITLIDPAGSFDTTLINTPVANTAPTAAAGNDQTIQEPPVGQTVTLDGTGSSDPENDTLTYAWSQLSGPAVTLSGANTATATFTAPAAPATLEFQLEVCDQEPLCDTDTVVVNVLPEAASTISINDPAAVTEGGAVSFTVSLSAAQSGTVTVDYATADGSATAPGDYTAATGTVTFVPGDTSETVIVQTIDDTDFAEPDTETFNVNLSNVTGNATIADGTGVGTINDNDVAPPVVDAAGDVIVNGPVGPSTRKTSKSFVFKVSNEGTTPITITAGDIITSVSVNGTATGTVDVAGLPVTLNPGSSKRLKAVWNYTSGAFALGATIEFSACVNLAGDVALLNNCDTATVTAK